MALTQRKKDRLVANQLKMKVMEGLKEVAASQISRILSDNSLPIYVLNTNYQEVGDRGAVRTAIVISLKSGENEQAPLVIPATWAPWCVTAAAPKEMIIKSFDFRQAVQAKEILLLEPETAEAVLENPEAQEEIARVAHKLRPREISDDYQDTNTTRALGNLKHRRSQVMRHVEVTAEEKAFAECSGAVRSFVSSFEGRRERGESITGPEVVDFLIMNGDEMSASDLNLVETELAKQAPTVYNDEDVKEALNEVADRLGV